MNLSRDFENEIIAPLNLFGRVGKRETEIADPVDVHGRAIRLIRSRLPGFIFFQKSWNGWCPGEAVHALGELDRLQQLAAGDVQHFDCSSLRTAYERKFTIWREQEFT